jgi:hypothetical protein
MIAGKQPPQEVPARQPWATPLQLASPWAAAWRISPSVAALQWQMIMGEVATLWGVAIETQSQCSPFARIERADF